MLEESNFDLVDLIPKSLELMLTRYTLDVCTVRVAYCEPIASFIRNTFP